MGPTYAVFYAAISWGFPRWIIFDGLLTFLVALVLWSMLLEIQCITSSSMYSTLRIGDRMLVEKVNVLSSFGFKLSFGYINQIMNRLWFLLFF